MGREKENGGEGGWASWERLVRVRVTFRVGFPILPFPPLRFFHRPSFASVHPHRHPIQWPGRTHASQGAWLVSQRIGGSRGPSLAAILCSRPFSPSNGLDVLGPASESGARFPTSSRWADGMDGCPIDGWGVWQIDPLVAGTAPGINECNTPDPGTNMQSTSQYDTPPAHPPSSHSSPAGIHIRNVYVYSRR